MEKYIIDERTELKTDSPYFNAAIFIKPLVLPYLYFRRDKGYCVLLRLL